MITSTSVNCDELLECRVFSFLRAISEEEKLRSLFPCLRAATRVASSGDEERAAQMPVDAGIARVSITSLNNIKFRGS